MNVKNIQILSDAEKDLQEGKTFYASQEHEIGIYFWDSLLSDIESLVIYAGVHSKEFGFYRMLSRRFPYAIYYEIKDEVAYVVAVLPIRRSPIWMKGKMRKRSQ